MKGEKKYIKKVISLLFFLLVLGFILNNSFYLHTHKINDKIFVHAHPFNKSKDAGKDNPIHKHSIIVLQLTELLILFFGIQLTILPYYPSFYTDIIYSLNKFYSTHFFSNNTGRAPPALV